LLTGLLLGFFKSLKERINGLKLGRKNCPTLGGVEKALFQDRICNFRRQGPAALGVLTTLLGIAWHVTHSPDTYPRAQSIPKSGTSVKKVAVQCNIASAKRAPA
jgi:hypothetical protein